MKVVSLQRLCSSLKPIHRRVPSTTKKMTGGGRYGGASGKLVRSSMKREERQGRSGIPPVNKVLCEVQRLKLLALRCSWFKFLFLVQGSYGNNQSRESKLLKGPSQIQSNTLAALEAIDVPVAEEVMDAGCIIGDRINGLVDGVSGAWFIKFDTFTPAVSRGLPVTRVILFLVYRLGLTCLVEVKLLTQATLVIVALQILYRLLLSLLGMLYSKQNFKKMTFFS
ncbi:uncharacterized protein LOC130496348 isoform X1 [Raphanus sativus]|uniref:Uncharacterized protein LOC108837576 isoform X1 n=2 Tax=Raphanus sativus TaxID=3726 RepID=A0A6J0M0Y1_RAPSA|nr:uncharacterized protein LOC108837576 isoform X1 [Raphanus sativus]XP_056844344.1 uncharacterized protein LOC130496348 isoform X1 [Raphanus sativus]